MPVAPPKDILIDSSSLFKTFKDGAIRSAFIAWIRRGRRRLVLSPMVVEEMLDHAVEEVIIEQLVTLGQIWRQLRPDHATWVRMPYDLFAVEARQEVSRTPTATLVERAIYSEHLKNAATVTTFVRSPRDPGRKAASAWKENLLKLDQGFQTKAHALRVSGHPGFDAGGMKKAILGYSGPAAESFLLEPITEEIRRRSGSAVTAADVVANPARYPILYAWACMAEITAWGNGLPPDDTSEIAHLLRPNRGSWYDNSIAASSAHCRLLLTQDKGLSWKAQLLKERGLVRFECLKIEDALRAKQGVGAAV